MAAIPACLSGSHGRKKAKIGYQLALLSPETQTFQRADGRTFLRILSNLPRFVLPVEWLGWAGEHNEIGPAYRLRREAFPSETAKVFYSDDDLSLDDMESLLQLSMRIEAFSSGLRAQGVFFWTSPQGKHVGLRFELAESLVKPSVIINGKVQPRQSTGGYALVLPKVGEFSCMLGVIEDDGTLRVLDTASYCMK